MQTRTKWILGGVAALLVSGTVLAGPALADGWGYGAMSALHQQMMGGRSPAQMQQLMSSGAMSQMHQQMMGSEMAGMHESMAPLMSQMPAMHEQVMGEVATLLQMELDQVTAALEAGQTLDELAEERKVAPGEIISTMTRNMKAFLDSAVEAGTITREQANQMFQMHQQHGTDCLNGGGMHSMMFGTSEQ